LLPAPENVCAGQSLHIEAQAVVVEYFPDGQLEQVSTAVAPTAAEKVPVGHFMQAEAPVDTM